MDAVSLQNSARASRITDDRSNCGREGIIAQHFSYLKRLMDEGIVILAGRTLNTDTSGFGRAIFNSESEEAAHQILLEDPAVKNNVFKSEIFPYRIALLEERNVRE